MSFDGHCILHSFAKRCGFPVSEEHAAGGLDSLTGDPVIVVRQQGSDCTADIVGQPDAPKGSLRREEFVDLFVVTYNAAGEIVFNRPGCDYVYADLARSQFLGHIARQHFDAALHRGTAG